MGVSDTPRTTGLHILRNPFGHSEEDVRAARLWAANEIERLERELAEANARIADYEAAL